MAKYNHNQIEAKWRKKWADDGMYHTPEDVTAADKMYILPQLPYPSGDGLHMGHSIVYSACDIYARFQRMKGKKVLQVIGWDSFGLPAENYAIKNNVHPKINTEKAIDNFREQIKSLGISVDWDREVGSHTPEYYKWTQWFFLLMYERGLAYRKKQAVNWCESCQTVLANEQVVNGRCERCDTEVVQKEMEQWYFKITEYADRLDADLDKVDWPEESVKRQRHWIGRKEGINITYQVKDTDAEITVFTTRPDTNFGATFIVVAPDSHFVKENIDRFENREAIDEYISQAEKKTELERISDGRKKTGVSTGLFAINQLTGREMPIYVSDFVLSTVGTGCVVGVPGHDVRDFEFAIAKGLDVIRVVVGSDGDESPITSVDQVQEEEGTMINSGFLDGLDIHVATEKIMNYLEEKGWGERVVSYRLRDWSVSRQRFWGSPIPMVYDPEGNLHPVKEEDLPVRLPDDVDFKPTGQSPLTYSEEFQEGVEEMYGKGWRREVDTLDTFMCSSWYYYRYLDPHNDQEFASREALEKWMPVDFYLGGPEHVNGHLLYSRFFTKVLYDAGYIDFDEPFLVHRHQGMIWGEDNRKMSKRWGNVVNPTDVVQEYGADTARTYLMFMGPLEQDKSWNSNAVQGVRRFLQRVYDFGQRFSDGEQVGELSKSMHKLIAKAEEAIPDLRFNVVVAEYMKALNEFEDAPEKVSGADWQAYLKLLAPFAPFLVEELWQLMGNQESIHLAGWPEFDPAQLQDDEVTVAVQVNGKVRAQIEISATETEDNVVKLALADEKVSRHIEGKKVIKQIYVPGRILNIVVA